MRSARKNIGERSANLSSWPAAGRPDDRWRMETGGRGSTKSPSSSVAHAGCYRLSPRLQLLPACGVVFSATLPNCARGGNAWLRARGWQAAVLCRTACGSHDRAECNSGGSEEEAMTINDLPAIMGTVLIVAGLALVGIYTRFRTEGSDRSVQAGALLIVVGAVLLGLSLFAS